jgi:hypothetical protein
MAPSLRLLFSAIASAARDNPTLRLSLRLHFVGTSYAGDRARKTVEPIAREFQIESIVSETTARVPYLQSLRLMQDAAIVLLIGSDDPGYAASKLYPCVMSRRPVLAICHEKSPLHGALSRCGGGRSVALEDEAGMAAAVAWALEAGAAPPPAIDEKELARYSAREMTRRQCEVFNRALGK